MPVNHLEPDHEPCFLTICVLCVSPVTCDVYFANDHICDECFEKAEANSEAEGGFFPSPEVKP